MKLRRIPGHNSDGGNLAALEKLLVGAELPAMPAAVTEAIRELSNPEFELRQVVELVARDPGVSARLLTVANSAAFSPRSEVTGVGQAVMMLGRNALESILLSMAAGAVINRAAPNGFDLKQFWQLAAWRSTTAGAFSERYDRTHRSENATSALLCDMAIPILHAVQDGYGELYARWGSDPAVALADLELEAYGWTNSQASAWMFEKWRFPSVIREAVLEQGDPISPTIRFPIVRLVEGLGSMGASLDRTLLVSSQAQTLWGIPVEETEAILLQAMEDSLPMVGTLAA